MRQLRVSVLQTCCQPGDDRGSTWRKRSTELSSGPWPGDPPNPGIELGSPALQADSLSSEPPGNPIVLYMGAYMHMCR